MVGYVKLGADTTSYITTNKTTTDHVLSEVTQKDCKILRLLKDKDICKYDIGDYKDVRVNE